MIFVKKKGVRKSVQRDPFGQMIIQPQQDILDPLILHGRLSQRFFDLIQLVEKFQEHAFGDAQGAFLQVAVDFQQKRCELPFCDGCRNLTVRAERTAEKKFFQLFAVVLTEKFHRDE